MKWTLSISKRNGEDPDLSVGSQKKKKVDVSVMSTTRSFWKEEASSSITRLNY